MVKKNQDTQYTSIMSVENPGIESRLAEHNTSIELIKQELRQEFMHMKESIDALATQFQEFRKEFINDFVTKEQHSNLESRVSEMENWKNWVLKIVVGSVIVALLALVGLSNK